MALLRAEGFPVTLEMVGSAHPPALKKLANTLKRVDPDGAFVFYSGPVPHSEIHSRYASVDLFLFASSCENMPNVLLEGMASGLPVACSNRGPMPEILQGGGVYFDPEVISDIADAIRTLVTSPELREEKAKLSFTLVQQYCWQRSAVETLEFLSGVARYCEVSRSEILQ